MHETFHNFFGLRENPFNVTSDPRLSILGSALAATNPRGLSMFVLEPAEEKTEVAERKPDRRLLAARRGFLRPPCPSTLRSYPCGVVPFSHGEIFFRFE